MNSQVTPLQGHIFEEDPQPNRPHPDVGGEREQQEKKSVVKKVKDKAKKIKNTIGKKMMHTGEGHDHGEAHGSDQHHHGCDIDEEEDEEEPEVHEAPMYDPTTTGQRSTAQVEGLGSTGPLEEDPHAPKDSTQIMSPSNYQTKVADPTASGGDETGVPPLPESFQAMKITDQSQVGHTPSTGSHDPFSPESPPPTKPHKSKENPQQVPDKPHESQPSNDQSYTSRISSAASAIAEKAASAKNVVASKLGYGRKDKGTETKTDTSEKSAGITDYGRNITSTVTEKLAPVYEKVAGAESAVVAKMHGAEGEKKGSDTDVKVAETGGGVKRSDKGVSVRKYVAEKVRPGAEDKALSEIISDALHKRKENVERESDQQESPKVDSISDRSVGPGMVGRMKGAVTSLFGMGGQSHEVQSGQEQQDKEHKHSAQVDRGHEDSKHSAEVDHAHVEKVEERKVQTSTNE